MRRALREYMNTGDRAAGRRTLGRNARAVGGTRASASHARAARTGGAALSALASVAQANGAAVVVTGFEIGTLAGRRIMPSVIAAVVSKLPPLTGVCMTPARSIPHDRRIRFVVIAGCPRRSIAGRNFALASMIALAF
jgi:hypothetical protein